MCKRLDVEWKKRSNIFKGLIRRNSRRSAAQTIHKFGPVEDKTRRKIPRLKIAAAVFKTALCDPYMNIIWFGDRRSNLWTHKWSHKCGKPGPILRDPTGLKALNLIFSKFHVNVHWQQLSMVID